MDFVESTRDTDSSPRLCHIVDGSPRKTFTDVDETHDDLELVTDLDEVFVVESLPSPREFLTSPEETILSPRHQKKFVSISELDPFFDELASSSTTSSLACDGDDVTELVDPGLPLENSGGSSCGSQKVRLNAPCNRTSSFRRIWSSLGSSNLPGLPAAITSKSQESNYNSSSDSKGEESDVIKKSFTHKLKKMSHKVRKQLSATGDFLAEKFIKHTVKSDSSLEEFVGPEEEKRNEKERKQAFPSERPTKENFKKGELASALQAEERKESCKGRDEKNTLLNKEPNYFKKEVHQIEPSKLIWQIPNWTKSVEEENRLCCLKTHLEAEKRRIAQKQPVEWAESLQYLRKSVGRDFRRGYLALGEKMQLPNFQVVRCLKFSQFHNHSFLAIGGEEGTLLLLELDYQKPLHQLLQYEESLQNLLYQVPVRSKCRIQMNETLVGHAYDLRRIAWNNANGKLLTSDEAGVIIGWGLGEKGCWVEELINDQSNSRICDMAWSPDGMRVVIGYEDFAGNGNVTGGVLVGFATGTQIYDKKFPGCQLNAVVWYSDSVVWAVVNFILYSFDEAGNAATNQRSIAMGGGPSDLVAFLLKPRSSWINSENAPEFLTVYKASCMTLFMSFSDKAPLKVHTQLTATCADWSSNGIYIAVGGMSASGANLIPQINLFNYEGKLLQILKVPENNITSVSWTHDSLHLAFASERQIYFANLRPMYKISSTKTAYCYAYTKDYANQWISFWNEETLFRESVPGKVIDIKGCNDKFSILCMDAQGIYHVFIFTETCVIQQHLCIVTMEPFALATTKNSVVCLAPNAILNWNFNLFTEEGPKKFTGALKTTRQVHVDDFPGIIVKPGEKQDHLLKPTLDCARCLHAVRDRLCVARESGKLQMYALPTLGFLQTYRLDLNGDICQEIRFNNDGTQLAILTMNGHLRICQFPEIRERRKDSVYNGQQIQLLFCEKLTSVTGFMWAVDMSHHLCVLEGNNIHFLNDDHIIETIANIPSGCYLTNYEGLRVTLIYMDKIIENPENPSAKIVIKLNTSTLSRIRESLDRGDSVDDIASVLSTSSYNHPILTKVLGDEALRQGDFQRAENIFMEEKNYPALRFMENINNKGLELQRAQIYCFLAEYEQAQHYFLRAGRKDLATKMWKDLGDWEKVSFLSGFNSEDATPEALEFLYDKFRDAQDWEMALETSVKLTDFENMLEPCVILEDYGKLVAAMESLSPGDPLLLKIGKVFASAGLIEEAAYCLSAYGTPESAMKIAVDTRHWDLAMKLSRIHNLPLIQPALVKHVKGLISANQLNPAIQILDRCGKILTAGKLLIWKGLRLLQDESCDTMEIKKIFVLAAKMLSRKKCRAKKGTIQSCDKQTANESEELDLEFLISKDHLEIMTGHNEWCWSDPWRGAEAIHFLNLAQRFIYRGMMGRAFKAAMHLRKFEDIVGFERINTLIALTAINNGYLNVASNALVKLEVEGDEYSEISFNLFKEHAPKDHDVSLIQCPGCDERIPDFYSTCPICNMPFVMCIFSACPISSGMEVWTCQTCSRNVESTKRDRFDYCLLCHSKIH